MCARDKERRRTCQRCKLLANCLVMWGKDCNRNGGTKVPRFDSLHKERDIYVGHGYQEPTSNIANGGGYSRGW